MESNSGLDRNSHGVGRFRPILAQVLATSVKNMLLFGVGMSGMYPMFVTAALHNATSGLSLDDEQTSWFGGLMFLVQPIGSILSGFLVEILGRKRSLMLVNVPYAAAWLLVFWGESSTTLFVAVVTLGICLGLQEAPAKTYAGEICETRLRGTLMSYTGVFFTGGMLLESFLGSVLNWRMVAAVNTVVPVFTFFALALIPDSPIWLVSRGRLDQAEASLCWLRGWVDPSCVREELQQLIQYNERRKERDGRAPLNTDEPTDVEDTNIVSEKWQKIEDHTTFFDEHGNVKSGNTKDVKFLVRLRSLLWADTRRPLTLTVVTFFFSVWSNSSGMMPFSIRIYRSYGLSVDPYWFTVYQGCIFVATSVILTALVARLGKRRILLFSTAGLILTNLGLGTYAYVFIPPGGQSTNNSYSWIVVMLITCSTTFYSMGIMFIPWMLLSEVFPLRTRGLASGLVASISQLILFIAMKTYLTMEAALHLHGMYWLYTAIGMLAVVYFYLRFPETEGISLQDIEHFFDDEGNATKVRADSRSNSIVMDTFSTVYKPCEFEMCTTSLRR